MGLTTQYHKFTAAGVCSIIASPKCNVVWLEYKGVKGKYCAVGACEDVIIWDVKTQSKLATLTGEKHEVVRLAASPNNKHVAVGYSNGSIKVYDFRSGEEIVTFSGHKNAVTTLVYDSAGMMLASGAKDTDIIVWDTVSESGLYRLKGHKGPITQIYFMRSKNILVSSSKDTFVKFWDLDTQHCFRTLLNHKTEVYGLTMNGVESRMYTGTADNEIHVFSVKSLDNAADDAEQPESETSKLNDGAPLAKRVNEGETSQEDEEEFTEQERILSCQPIGSVNRSGKGRTINLTMDVTGRSLMCHGIDKSLELFLVLSDDEKKTLMNRRAAKARKRQRVAGEADNCDLPVSDKLTVEDELRRHAPVRMPSKPVSVEMITSPAGVCKVLCMLSSNSLYMCMVDLSDKKSEVTAISHMTNAGHRTDVRALCFSNDGTALASASAENVKVWNRDSLQCIRTMECGYALCCAFLPGDRHIVVGCKSGKLQLFDIGSATMLEELDAHTGALWSLCLSPDKRGLVTGSADQEVKFWNFELISDDDDEGDSGSGPGKRLTLSPSRVLKMSDDVLCVKLSVDKRFLAVSLLDNTIKVFFADTLKFFLSLYGHSLPALSIDISTDGTLLVSGSADKNVKIWGLDFGDCHRSLFAHDDSVMGVQFLPKTHLFLSCGKDGSVKQWDADTFNHISTLKPSHHGEVWSVVCSPNGMSVASSAHDKSLRVWEKCEEVLVLEEERQEEREKEYEDELEKEENPVVPGETSEEIGFANKKTVESVKSTEKIMEAVELWRTESTKIVKSDNDLHPMLRAFNCKHPQDFVLHILTKIKSSELEEALLVMPFDYATDLLIIINAFIQKGQSVEMLSKCLLFLLRIHHGQITSNHMLLPTIDSLRETSCSKAQQIKDQIGFNISGLQLLKLRLEDKKSDRLFADATSLFKAKEKQRKKKSRSDAINAE